jgi:hypothetical protein
VQRATPSLAPYLDEPDPDVPPPDKRSADVEANDALAFAWRCVDRDREATEAVNRRTADLMMDVTCGRPFPLK